MPTLYLICYDIKDDRRRTKVANLLEIYGLRVQKSVFETMLDQNQYQKLETKLAQLINKTDDQLRFYPLSQLCRNKVKILGFEPEFTVSDRTFIV